MVWSADSDRAAALLGLSYGCLLYGPNRTEKDMSNQGKMVSFPTCAILRSSERDAFFYGERDSVSSGLGESRKMMVSDEKFTCMRVIFHHTVFHSKLSQSFMQAG